MLVKPEIAGSKNSVGRRGSLHVSDDSSACDGERVDIVIDYPEMTDMNGLPAHAEVIPLTKNELETLLTTENAGAYTYTLRTADGPSRSI